MYFSMIRWCRRWSWRWMGWFWSSSYY